MGVRENKVERYLDEQVKSLGGVTRKFTSPGHDGVADRLCFLPGGLLWLVEVKTDEGRESPQQARERDRMLDLGFRSRIVYGHSGVDLFLEEVIVALDHRVVIQEAIDECS